MTQKQANDIAKIFITSSLLPSDGFNAENLSEKDNQKVRDAVKSICMKLLSQTKVGSAVLSDFDAVNMVLNNQ
ncbi:MAG TPA: hypothetical protein ENK66_01940 [Arcobacter sp.]|nr:hypothetical protein [Arcobacter sp.]